MGRGTPAGEGTRASVPEERNPISLLRPSETASSPLRETA